MRKEEISVRKPATPASKICGTIQKDYSSRQRLKIGVDGRVKEKMEVWTGVKLSVDVRGDCVCVFGYIETLSCSIARRVRAQIWYKEMLSRQCVFSTKYVLF